MVMYPLGQSFPFPGAISLYHGLTQRDLRVVAPQARCLLSSPANRSLLSLKSLRSVAGDQQKQPKKKAKPWAAKRRRHFSRSWPSLLVQGQLASLGTSTPSFLILQRLHFCFGQQETKEGEYVCTYVRIVVLRYRRLHANELHRIPFELNLCLAYGVKHSGNRIGIICVAHASHYYCRLYIGT